MVGNSSENMVVASMWSSMAAWFTPVVLFGLMNLIVAIIFIANNNNNKDNNNNNNKKHNEQDQHEDYQVRGGGDIFTRLTRVNSLFERVKSINVSSFIATTKAESQSQQENPLATYSSLSRLAQSIHFPTRHGTRSGGSESTQSEPENHPPPRRTTAGNRSSLERIKSVRFSESSQISDSLSQLVRAPSIVLERVKSLKIIKISSPFKSSGAPITDSEGPIAKPDHNSIRSKSEKSSKNSTTVEIKKTRSEIRLPASDDEEEEDYDSRRPATAREARNSGDAGVDAKADDFITRFRQQLKLQRVESLVRYNDILQRRTSY